MARKKLRRIRTLKGSGEGDLRQDDAPERVDQTELADQDVERQDGDRRREEQTEGEIGEEHLAAPEREAGEDERGGAGETEDEQGRGDHHHQAVAG